MQSTGQWPVAHGLIWQNCRWTLRSRNPLTFNVRCGDRTSNGRNARAIPVPLSASRVWLGERGEGMRLELSGPPFSVEGEPRCELAMLFNQVC